MVVFISCNFTPTSQINKIDFYTEVYASLKCTANKSNRPAILMEVLLSIDKSSGVKKLSWSRKFKEDPVINVSIYLQTLLRDSFCGSARITPQKQIFKTFQVKSIWLNEPQMFILYSAQKMTNNFCLPLTGFLVGDVGSLHFYGDLGKIPICSKMP